MTTIEQNSPRKVILNKLTLAVPNISCTTNDKISLLQSPWTEYLINGNIHPLREIYGKSAERDINDFHSLAKRIKINGFQNVADVIIDEHNHVNKGVECVSILSYFYGDTYEITLIPIINDKDNNDIYTKLYMVKSIPTPEKECSFNIISLGDSHSSITFNKMHHNFTKDVNENNIINCSLLYNIYLGAKLAHSYSTYPIQLYKKYHGFAVEIKCDKYQAGKYDKRVSNFIETHNFYFSNKFTVTGDSMIIFCFGEIDCRCHVHKHITDTTSWKNVIEILVKKYVDTVVSDTLKTPSGSSFFLVNTRNICIFNVPPPFKNHVSSNVNLPILGTDEERVNYSRYFNECTKRECDKHNLTFIDVYDKYCDEEGFIKPELSDGKNHILDQKYVVEFLEQQVPAFYLRSPVYSVPSYKSYQEDAIYIYLSSSYWERINVLASVLRIARKEKKLVYCYWEEKYTSTEDKTLHIHHILFDIEGLYMITKKEFIKRFLDKKSVVYNKKGLQDNSLETIYIPQKQYDIKIKEQELENKPAAHVFYRTNQLISYKEDEIIGKHTPYPVSNTVTSPAIEEIRDIVHTDFRFFEVANPYLQDTWSDRLKTDFINVNENAIGIQLSIPSEWDKYVSIGDEELYLSKLNPYIENIKKVSRDHPDCTIFVSIYQFGETFPFLVQDIQDRLKKICDMYPEHSNLKVCVYMMSAVNDTYSEKMRLHAAIIPVSVAFSKYKKFYGTCGCPLSYMIWLMRKDNEILFIDNY